MWYRKAADQGDPRAQSNLGFAYASGQGVTRDLAQAAAWYRKAAEQGHATSQFDLGAMYASGQGVLKDYVEAHKWVNLAASRAATADDRAQFARTRDDLAKRLTPADLDEARKRARDWADAFERASKK